AAPTRPARRVLGYSGTGWADRRVDRRLGAHAGLGVGLGTPGWWPGGWRALRGGRAPGGEPHGPAAAVPVGTVQRNQPDHAPALRGQRRGAAAAGHRTGDRVGVFAIRG